MKNSAWKEKLRQAADEFNRTNIWLYATSGAYYLFFSLGPLAVLFLGLLPYLPVSEQALQDAILFYTPEPFQELIHAIVSDVYSGSATALGVGLVTELWSAGKFLSLVMRGVGQIYDGQAYGGYLRRRLMGALYTAALIVLVLGNLVLLFFGERFLAMSAINGLWSAVIRGRVLVFLATVTVLNALLFRYVPHKKLVFRRQLPGAVFSAVTWLAFSRVYSWAVDRFRFFSIYGGLAIVIISLFWMYCSLYLLFFGAWLNTLREENR